MKNVFKVKPTIDDPAIEKEQEKERDREKNKDREDEREPRHEKWGFGINIPIYNLIIGIVIVRRTESVHAHEKKSAKKGAVAAVVVDRMFSNFIYIIV